MAQNVHSVKVEVYSGLEIMGFTPIGTVKKDLGPEMWEFKTETSPSPPAK